MNTYNDNLHNSVVSSLNAQELQLNQNKAQLNASMFSLYYAQGALFTAYGNLEFATDQYEQAKGIELEAVNNSDVSSSMLTTAQLANTNVGLAVSNAAVAAANVEIASNAILKLASDVGSIFSIVSAADFGKDIYDQSKYAHAIMDKTAYDAENTSRYAMNASQLTAEVSSAAVEAAATSANTAITDLQNIATTDLENATTLLETNNQAYAEASVAERKAEGELEDNNVEFYASESSYYISNDELNLGLRVEFPIDIEVSPAMVALSSPLLPLEPSKPAMIEGLLLDLEKDIEVDANLGKLYSVSFNRYKSSFKPPNDNDNSLEIPNDFSYPVKMYYIMLVKNKSKSTFNLASAENILVRNDENQMVPVDPYLVKLEDQDTITRIIYQNRLIDSDGDDMIEGEEYVVFVLAQFEDQYKKILNVYDDYLTAPSASFKLYTQLKAAVNLEVVMKPELEVELKENNEKIDLDIEIDKVQILKFKAPYSEADKKIEYRCMFLPKEDGIKGLLTASGLRNLEAELKRLEKIAATYDPGIRQVIEEINSLFHRIEELQKIIKRKKNELRILAKKPNGKESEQYKELELSLKEDINDLKYSKRRLIECQNNLLRLEKSKEETILMIQTLKESKCGFFFNLTIAEQVSAANYISDVLVGEPSTILTTESGEEVEESKGKGKKKSSKKKKDFIEKQVTPLKLESKPISLLQNHYVIIDPNTTDNFGNRLKNNDEYIPVVLSYSDVMDANKPKFMNALSDIDGTGYFTYMDEETIFELTLN